MTKLSIAASATVVAILAIALSVSIQDAAFNKDSRQLLPGGARFSASSIEVVLRGDLADLYSILDNPFDGLTFDEGGPVNVSVELLTDADPVEDELKDLLTRPDAFRIELRPAGVNIVGTSRAAVIYALDHLAGIYRENDGQLPSGKISDWAEHDVRALHFLLRDLTEVTVREIIDKARLARMNTLIIMLADDVRFDSKATVARRSALTKAQLVSVVRYARASGMEIIPNVPLLTKQHKFFKTDRPDLMYNNTTYDPSNPELYSVIFEYLDELIETLQPAAIHIGHDEVEGIFPRSKNKQWTPQEQKKRLKPGDKVLPPWLFFYHVERVNNYLRERGVRTWMWGDMLISGDEFPGMDGDNLNGSYGYADLRKKLPRDILICDWHYKHKGPQFETTRAFMSDGFEVLGTTWNDFENIESFSRYTASLSGRTRGMVATTWFLVRQNEWETVDKIIAESGRLYWSPERAR